MEVNDIPVIFTLPFDVLSFTLSFESSFMNMFNLALTCKRFYTITKHPSFWRQMLQKRLREPCVGKKWPNVITQAFCNHADILIEDRLYLPYIWKFTTSRASGAIAATNCWRIGLSISSPDMGIMMVVYQNPDEGVPLYVSVGTIDTVSNKYTHCEMKYYGHPNYRRSVLQRKVLRGKKIDTVQFIEYHNPITQKTFYGRGQYLCNNLGMIPDEEHGAWK